MTRDPYLQARGPAAAVMMRGFGDACVASISGLVRVKVPLASMNRFARGVRFSMIGSKEHPEESLR